MGVSPAAPGPGFPRYTVACCNPSRKKLSGCPCYPNFLFPNFHFPHSGIKKSRPLARPAFIQLKYYFQNVCVLLCDGVLLLYASHCSFDLHEVKKSPDNATSANAKIAFFIFSVSFERGDTNTVQK
jgi:hypothetical protein